MFIPLYSENYGLGGFKCKDCGKVTRTRRGIVQHIWRVHAKKAQIELFAEPVRPVQRHNDGHNDGQGNNK